MFKRFNCYGCILGIAFLLVMLPVALHSISAQAGEDTKGLADLKTAISRVAKDNVPAVVHIEVTRRQGVVSPMLPFKNDHFFRYFFDIHKMPPNFEQELKGLGTGMIIDSDGHILTNNHVVAGATQIQALLSSGKRYPAEVVGTDPKTDLAVIKISGNKPLPHITFGNSDKVEVGEWVVAIGHPRGLDQTVTQGIISAKHRQGIMDPSTYQDFLQTDAAINPANSGGPLLNLRGEVVGVNAAIVSKCGGFEGIGFAVPSNMVLYIAKTLIANGQMARGWLGVSVQDVTPELAGSFGMDIPKGALVADVAKGGPADRAGIKRGDVVIAYQGEEIPDTSTLQSAVATTPIGQEVKMNVLRKGKKLSLTVKIGKLQDATKTLTISLKDPLGAEFRLVTAKEAKNYNLGSHRGVAVVWLDPKGPFRKVGFEVGDVILEINSQIIKSLEGFVDLVSSFEPHQRITFLALDHRSGQTGYVQVVVR